MLSEVRTRPPLIVTERLALRELKLDDARAVADRAGDKRVARYLIAVPSPYPVSLATRWIVGRLAWWGTAWLRGRVVTDLVVDAVLGDDATHVVAGLPGTDGSVSLVRALGELRSAMVEGIGLAVGHTTPRCCGVLAVLEVVRLGVDQKWDTCLTCYPSDA